MSQKVSHARDQGAIQAIKGEIGEGCNMYGTLQAQKVRRSNGESESESNFHDLQSCCSGLLSPCTSFDTVYGVRDAACPISTG
jgi:hypothetical protein